MKHVHRRNPVHLFNRSEEANDSPSAPFPKVPRQPGLRGMARVSRKPKGVKEFFPAWEGPSPDSTAMGSPEESRAFPMFDPLNQYFAEIRRFPLLSREEEFNLARSWWEKKDPGAAYRLMVSNLRIVIKIAFGYQSNRSKLLDLIQEGNIGLIQAVKKFDPFRNTRLSSYAAWWIRAYILKFLVDNWSLVKIGTTQGQRKLFFRLRKEKRRLESLGFAPDPKLLAESFNVSQEELIETEQRLAGGDFSLDHPLDEDSHRTHGDLIPAVDSLEEKFADDELKDLVNQKIEEFSHTLKDKEFFLLKNRLMTEDPMTLRATGDQLRISRERARQIEIRVAKMLKDYLKRQLPELDVMNPGNRTSKAPKPAISI